VLLKEPIFYTKAVHRGRVKKCEKVLLKEPIAIEALRILGRGKQAGDKLLDLSPYECVSKFPYWAAA